MRTGLRYGRHAGSTPVGTAPPRSGQTAAPLATRVYLLDDIALLLAFILSCLPFSQVVIARVTSGLTLFAYDFIYLALVLVFLVKLLTARRLEHPSAFFLLLAAIAVSTAVALTRSDAPSLHLILYQSRNYLPFVVAALIVATGTAIPLRRLLLALCAGAIVSAAAALAVNYLFPAFLVGQFSFAEEIGNLAVTQGRLHWTNDSLVFIPFLAAALLPRLRRHELGLVVIAGVVTSAASFSRLNRTILAGLAAYVVILLLGSLFARRARGAAAPIIGRIFTVLLLLGGLVYALLSTNPQLASTASERFPTNAEKLQGFLSGDVGAERGPIWSHYLEFPVSTYVLGQGLGKPLIVSDRVIYTSDVSYFALLLVFGFLGLASLVAFLWALFARLHSPTLPRPPNPWALTALVVVVILISLNVDWLSRDNMVIYLGLLVMSATGPRTEHVPSHE